MNLLNNLIIFHLKKFWDGKDLWEEIKSGRKTIEWREAKSYWIRRLLGYETLAQTSQKIVNFTKGLIVHKAWFVIGYPKNNLPRLEADVIGLIYYHDTKQFGIKIANVKEVTKMNYYGDDPVV